MIATRVSALGLAVVLSVCAAANAQTPSQSRPPGATGAPTWAPGSQLHHEMRRAARIKAFHDALNIRPDQEGAFQAFAASMRPEEHGARAEEIRRGRQEMAGMTTPERLDAMSRMMDEHMQRVRERFQRHATAVKALYAVLSPEQRRTLDALPDLMDHGMGMDHHGPMDEHHIGADSASEHE